MKDARYIDLKGTYNFRDIGGYVGTNNKKVLYGKLYRSDELSKLCQEDIMKIQELKIKTIIDYRSVEERKNNEDVEIEATDIYYLDPKADIAAFASSNLTKSSTHRMEELTAKTAKFMMVEQNRQFVLSKSSHCSYRKMFDIILDENNIAIVQHCRGGKDRTGFGCALILLALGVSKEDVIADYMLTNVYKKEKNETSLQQVMIKTGNIDLVQALRYLKEANQEFIETAFMTMEEVYGDAIAFMKEALHLQEHEFEKLRALYLEK